MPDRIAMWQMYMRWAADIAEFSTCNRLKVGAIVTSPDLIDVYSNGYNGGPMGQYNECLSNEPGKCGHIHAEDNACNKAPARIPKVMFVTHFPCRMCCIRMVNKMGFETLFYWKKYRDFDGLEILQKAGISVVQMDPRGLRNEP